MGRISTTHYNPALGVKYLIKNKRTGEIVTARALGIQDKDHSPIRSTKETPRGQEFFKMALCDDVIVFLNSLNYDGCFSDDGKWEFLGQRPNGEKLEKRNKIENPTTSIIEFTSTDYKKLMGAI